MRLSQKLCLSLVLLFAALALNLEFVSAQVPSVQVIEPPTSKFLFFEDVLDRKKTQKKKKEIQQKQSEVIKKARAAGFPYDVNATNINYDTANKKLVGEGGVIISYASAIIEAERGEISTEDQSALLEGDVRLSDISGTIAADQMSLKLDDGTGFFKQADMFFEDGHYRINAEEVRKISKDDFTFQKCSLTTCDCADADSTDPWRIEGADGQMTREGYGTIHDGLIYAYNIPVFYSPYLRFPVKTKRASGLLPSNFGGGQNSGFRFALPLYMVIDESTDDTFTVIYNSRARVGFDNEFRKVFSDNTSLIFDGLYFDESMRGNRFFGINPSGYRNRRDPATFARKDVLDDIIGPNRWGGYLDFKSMKNQLWGNDLNFIVSGKAVSDAVLLREYNRQQITDYKARFVTSRADMTYSFLDNFTLDVGAEYNQAIYDNQDQTLQRLPDVSVGGTHVINAFGENDLGAKLVINDQIEDTYFDRKDLFDGNRAQIYETATIPFHYQNYFDVKIGGDLRASQYDLNDTEKLENVSVTLPDGTLGSEQRRVELPSSSNRVLPGFSTQVSTVLEKVFDVSDSNPLKFLTELGTQGRQGELKRIKHTLEPDIRYRFVPYVDQKDNPQFDSTDVLPKRNLVTYSLMQRFYGRFEGRDANIYGVEETTPEASDLDALSSKTPIDQAFDLGMGNSADAFAKRASGQRAELFNFAVSQTYDVDAGRERDKLNSLGYDGPKPFSDLTFASNLIPNEYFRLNSTASVETETRNFTGYTIGGQFLDKRGDQLRIGTRFTDGALGAPTHQAEESLELRITDRFKLGAYSRFDVEKMDFLEKRVGMRLNSSCRCWILDLDVWNRAVPDQTIVQFTLTLNGISEFGTGLWSTNQQGTTQ